MKSELLFSFDMEQFLTHLHISNGFSKKVIKENLKIFYKLYKYQLYEVQSLDLFELSIKTNNLTFLKIIYKDCVNSNCNGANNNRYDDYFKHRGDLIDIGLTYGEMDILEYLHEKMSIKRFNTINAIENCCHSKNKSIAFKFLINNLKYEISNQDFKEITQIINPFTLDRDILLQITSKADLNIENIIKIISIYLEDSFILNSDVSIKTIFNIFYIIKNNINPIPCNNLHHLINKIVSKPTNGIEWGEIDSHQEKEIIKFFIFEFLMDKEIKPYCKEKDLLKIGLQYIIHFKEYELIKLFIVHKKIPTSTLNVSDNFNHQEIDTNSFCYKYGVRFANFHLFQYIYFNFRECFNWNDRLAGGFIASKGDVELMKFIHDNNLNDLIDPHFIIEHGASSNIEMVHYLNEKGYTVSSLSYSESLKHGKDEIFLYLLENTDKPIDLNIQSISHNLNMPKLLNTD
ncbi:hypothetical protein DICPUDRAFT_160254 [Dictyostelium purpureum]|uniref:Ankyrin repeat protein n=1 Tax=Dictyostelium purpureum TaxID=5786 RepID=F1A605_DICPU|nr:uncharacterized protein DICPUDRAFT_160254 [Dictyostelium purpureum]EGC28376.1 hypothetical protein DICPUDRAFT_160254 [Dictyostelium purpureum]|eukprot:XP_003295099.1 hypothetical protein DICPUDRAFT_160254 [Dictyostelium purpureum]